jgi:hypothetical protein
MCVCILILFVPSDLIVGVVSVLQGVLVSIEVKVDPVVQHDWQVVRSDIEVITIPLAENGVMLNGRLPHDALVILVVLQSVIDPSEHAITHHGVPVVTTLDVFEAAHLMSLWHGIH